MRIFSSLITPPEKLNTRLNMKLEKLTLGFMVLFAAVGLIYIAVDVFIINPGNQGVVRHFNMRPVDMEQNQFEEYGFVKSAWKVLPPAKQLHQYKYLVIGGMPSLFDDNVYLTMYPADGVVIYENGRGLAVFTDNPDNEFLRSWATWKSRWNLAPIH